MIVRAMNVHEFDSTVICFNYYRDEAIQSMPEIEQEYDENSVIRTIKTYASKGEYCWFNAYEGTRVVGFVAGYLVSQPWNEKILTANISFIYLLESHRTLANFKQLMTEFENWSKLYGATYVTGGDIGINIDRSKTLYEHMGFKPLLLMSKELINE